ncbi:hypothetical protein N7462_000523 [Penicillium macrosclerotiorum]|uniref:uncharacterized protein n=1 Tax=Penicillium macrosclerotiorum TaxID=303699 RepID=UPI0025487036|nr:uncharacterized protein N7462_000523 [Penicillium macrosclerotiorum]KAJ5698518.1 hypothetical protein N7462_000523 [Penicillium macrosclerotiorum]
MAYYDDRRYDSYDKPRDRGRPSGGYSADYPDDHPRTHYARHERATYRGSDGSIEEIQRDFPPGGEYFYERGYNSRRTRQPAYETVRRASSVSGYDPYYDDRSHRSRRSRHYYDDRRPHRSRYSSDGSRSPSPRRHSRRKSLGETALGALGLGALASKHDDQSDRSRHDRGRSQSRRRGRSYSSSRSRSRSRDRNRDRSKRERSEQRIAQAAKAGLTAAVLTAWRERKGEGEWTGARGKRVLTAAITAAGADGLVDKDPNKHAGRNVMGSALAGLAANHFLNGPSKKSDGQSGGSGFKDLAASGALAAAGKEIYDRFSRSRSRPRGRDEDRAGSDDERHGSSKRSKSVSDYIGKGMAALGLHENSEHERDRSRGRDDRSHSRSRHDRYDRDGRRRRDRDSRHDGYSDSDSDTEYRSRDRRRGRSSRDVGRYRSMNDTRTSLPYTPASTPRGGGERGVASTRQGSRSSSESDSDLGDSSDEKKQRKKMKRDMLLTGGLAAVTTIHAAHTVHGGITGRKKRMQQLRNNEITPEEARRARRKSNLRDLMSIGLAGIGMKAAYREWNEVNSKRKESATYREQCAQRAIRRERRRAQSQGALPSRRRWPDEIEYPPSVHESTHTQTHAHGFTYHDGNPYGATIGQRPAISY